jgi:predicted nucleotide-binding protein (sugar kinase/HSP70/actin superfamily)
MEEKGRIGIPRALMFYRYFPLWKVFFEELGWRVIVSDGVGKRGKLIYFEDSCLPMKLLVTHSVDLREKADHLFVPRLVSLHRHFIMCPKFRGAPDIVRLAMERRVSILDETIDHRTKEDTMIRSFLKIGKRLGTDEKEGKRAFQKAEQLFYNFQKGWEERVNGLPSNQLFRIEAPFPPEEKERPWRVAFVGHPYNLFDTDVNKDILSVARSLGMRIITPEGLSEKEIDAQVSDLSKEIYWSSGREIVGSLFHFLSGGVDGVVFLTSFKCGIDALLQEVIKRGLKVRGGTPTPFLVLTLDEHSGREGLTTRLEAFKDVIEERKSNSRIVRSSYRQ